jgi:hypothetical protein
MTLEYDADMCQKRQKEAEATDLYCSAESALFADLSCPAAIRWQ